MSILRKLKILTAGAVLTVACAAAPVFSQVESSASLPPTSASASMQSIENPYDLKHMLMQGDTVTLVTFALLVLMSAASWYILVTKLIDSFRLSTEAKQARLSFFRSATLADGIKTLKPGGVFQFIAESGIEAGRDHSGELTANIDRNTWIGMSVQRAVDTVHSRLQDGLAVLATVGSTAPFIGLFGTVWGILNALTAIGVAGQASIDKVAGPVGEALIMTAIGLAVAVPAVLSYNWLVRRNKLAMESVRGFAADLHGVLLGSRAATR